MKLPSVVLAVFLTACSSDETPAGSDTSAGGGGGGGGAGGSPPAPTQTTFGGERPVELKVPSDYDHGSATPLLVLLHGYTATGTIQNVYFGLEAPALERGFLYAYPDGTIDAGSNHFWNATDACCDFGKIGVDDSGYLRSVVDEIRSVYNVDDKRIFFMGHSNGSFMSYRMACDHADIIAGIAGLAGAMWGDTSKCDPSEPVHVLHIHGDADTTIVFDGGATQTGAYPSAPDTVEHWADFNGCSATPSDGGTIDLDADLDGSETTVTRYDDGCSTSNELWTIQGGGHIPSIGEGFMPSVLDFMLAHPKP